LKPGFDIFCRVIDNYGDIGVCWRLARQLASVDKGPVRLWVDRLESFARLEPGVRPHVDIQNISDIAIVHWTASLPDLAPHGVVIETFGCALPERYRAKLGSAEHLWFNLDYLSAESWIEDFHGLPSLQPDGLNKRFLFPGFTPATAGLLREDGLIAKRDAWNANPALRWALLDSIGVPAARIEDLQQGGRQIMLFCYQTAPFDALFDALARLPQHSVVLAPQGVMQPPLPHMADHVHLVEIPFVSQPCFDRLLWSSDLNIVRGEDSFIRATWAGRPFIWHIYEQDHDTHLVKLDAWLNLAGLPADAAQLMRDWNSGQTSRVSQGLGRMTQPDNWKRWQDSTQTWTESLCSQTDLATRLLDLCGLANGNTPNTLK